MISLKMKIWFLSLICGLFFCINPLLAQREVTSNDTIVRKQKEISPAYIIGDSIQNRFINTGNVTKFEDQGMGMSTRIMSTAILNINVNPLIVINGVPYQNIAAKGFDFTTAGERDYAAMIGIPQNDIEEIAIVQDATSIAQFGSSAANGVILVTTRHGLKGKSVFNYRYEGSVRSQPKGYDILEGDQYIMLMREEYHNAFGIYTIPEELAYDPSSSLFYLYTQNTDWLKEITRTGQAHDHYFSATGGFKKLDYRVSAGYLTQQGITVGTGQKRFNSRLDMNYSITDRLKVLFDMGYSHTIIDNNIQKDGSIPIQELALKKIPNMSIYERDADGNATGDYYVPSNNFQGNPYIWYNPVATANLAGDNNKVNLINPTFNASYRLFKNLVYNFYLSYNSSNNKRIVSDPNLMTDSLAWNIDRRMVTENEFDVIRTQNQFTFTPYHNNDHSLIASALFNTFAKSFHNEGESYENSVVTSTSSFDAHYKDYFSVFSVNYQFRKKYVLDISGMMDGISVQGSSFDYKFYPSATLKWMAAKESFMRQITFVNDLTFMVSHSELGNNSDVNLLGYNNKERNIQQDIGVNVLLLKNKLNINFLVYKKEVKDPLEGRFVIVMDPGGFRINYIASDNINRGWEIGMNANLVQYKNFSTDFSLNLYRNRTLTEQHYQTGDPASGENYIRKVEANKPMGSIYGYQLKGVYIDDQDAIAKDKNGNSIYGGDGIPVYTKFNSIYTFQGGDAKYADQNFDGIINASDIVYLGDANPYFTGSGGPSFRYKGWWLGIYFNFRLSNKIINMARMSLEDMNSKSNQSIAVLNRWRAPGMQADLPRACLNNPVNSLGSDRFVENGSFLRLKTITLKYQLPETFVKNLHVKGLEFYAIGSNLMTFTHYTGADPEIGLYGKGSDIGTDYNFVPRFKEFTFGVNVDL